MTKNDQKKQDGSPMICSQTIGKHERMYSNVSVSIFRIADKV